MAEQQIAPTTQAMSDDQALKAYIAGKEAIENPNKFGVDPSVVSTQGMSSTTPVGLRITSPQVQQVQPLNPEFPQMGQPQAPAEVAKPGELPTDKKPEAQGFDLGKEIVSKMKQGFDLQQQGIAAAEKVGKLQGAQEAKYLEELVKAKQEAADNSLKLEKVRQDNLAKVENEISQMKIEPNRVWNKATTEQKIGMSLGMILGGVGAAFTGGKNTVIDSINKMIEADTEAQKADINKKQNLYSMMYKRLGDERAAEAASNIYKFEGLQTKLQQVAAQFKGQQAGANAIMAQGQLSERIANEYGKLRESLSNSPAMMAQETLTKKVFELPKEYREHGLKELAAYKEIQSNLNQVKDIFEDMGRLQTVGQRIGSPIQSSSMMETQKARLFPIIKSIMGEAIQEADVKRMIEPYLISLKDDEKTRIEKQQNLTRVLESKIPGRTPILSGMGLLPKTIQEGKAK